MISGKQLKDALISGANNMANHKNSVDALNIFPVPDGDTGTNMSWTMAAAKKELLKLPESAPVSLVASTAAAALLRGARGNSGAILSLIFRGISNGLKGCEEASGAVISTALALASENAYKSVMSPTEGTILTVIRCAGEAAKKELTLDIDAAHVFAAALDGARAALKKTPELLHVLKKAKVVDAGGQGLVYILEGMQSVFEKGEIIEAVESMADSAAPASGVSSEADIRFTYCTEFIINRKNGSFLDALLLRSFLEGMGDCVVVVEDEDIIKVHVHSNKPGEVLNRAMEYGELINVKIENMKQQHRNASWGTNADLEAEESLVAPAEKPYGFVCIGAGEGITELFAQLGADNIVSGGQTMNPSAEDILNAVNKTPAETVFVLPNNKNIILTAQQMVDLTQKKAVIIPTRTIPAGVSAMLAFDAEASIEENQSAMQEAVERVQTASVTFAARDSTAGGLNIKKGQMLGLENGKIVTVDDDPNACAYKVVKKLIKRNTSVITVYYGDGITEEKAMALVERIAQKADSAEVVPVYGGQPVYYYIISVE